MTRREELESYNRPQLTRAEIERRDELTRELLCAVARKLDKLYEVLQEYFEKVSNDV